MGKVIFWLLVIFAVLFALRLYNSAKSKREAAAREPIRRRMAQFPKPPPCAYRLATTTSVAGIRSTMRGRMPGGC